LLRLLLFDIDGTLLLKASREHAEALHAALRRVHRIEEIPAGRVDAAGRTDGEIARTILTLAGVPAERIDACAQAVRLATCDEYAKRCPADLTDRLAPGIQDVLERLAAGNDVKLAVVTGNFQPVARLKLQRAGIEHYFPLGQGAFGSDHEDRAALPAIARRRAGHGRIAFPREHTVVIGDTPRDVACARADGVHVIGIATGPFRADELVGADAVVGHARAIPKALAQLDGRAVL
jgi:phosphoglycolate phosphatase-like HAD superfamily hydrolase